MRIILFSAILLILFFQIVYPRTVQDVINSGECSTEGFKPLSVQAVEAFKLIAPDSVTKIEGVSNLDFSGAVIPYLQTPAAIALKKAAQSARIQINSLIRAFPQQVALYTWYKTGRCGIPLAAAPGSSPHESGLGVDVGNYGNVQTPMRNQGFSWQGSGDPVHFTYTGSGIKNLEGKGIQAFQMLWNCNNPNDKISVTGSYDESTKNRALKSPAEGFPQTCQGGSGGQDSADIKMTLPSVIKVKTDFYVTGSTFNGVVSVKLKLDDQYEITTIPVDAQKKFSFKVNLNTGGNRKFEVQGFTSDNKVKSVAYRWANVVA